MANSYVKVKCHECGKEGLIYSRLSTEAKCLECGAVLGVPTGGKAHIKAEIIELVGESN